MPDDRLEEIKEYYGHQFAGMAILTRSQENILWLIAEVERERAARPGWCPICHERIYNEVNKKIKKLKAENAELKQQNESVEHDWAHCADGWSKCQLDLKCLEESTVDKKAWDQKIDEMIELKQKLATSEKARRI